MIIRCIKVEIWPTQVVFHCEVTYGRRSLSFAVPVAPADAGSGAKVKAAVKDAIQNFPYKAQVRDAEVWEGFEVTLG